MTNNKPDGWSCLTRVETGEFSADYRTGVIVFAGNVRALVLWDDDREGTTCEYADLRIEGDNPPRDDESDDISDDTGERACNDFAAWAANH